MKFLLQGYCLITIDFLLILYEFIICINFTIILVKLQESMTFYVLLF